MDKYLKFPYYSLLLIALGICPIINAQSVVKISTNQYNFVEGPTWDGNDNVYFTDVNGNAIIKYSVSKNTFKTLVSNTQKANGMMYNTDKRLVVCEGDAGVVNVRDTNGLVIKTLKDKYNNIRFNSPNDLCIDGKGGVYFSDPTWSTMHQNQNRLYYVSASGTITAVISDMQKPNGVIISVDGKTLYVDDSWSTTIRSYDILADGSLANKKDFAIIKLPIPTDNVSGADGMALDYDGNLYVACKLGILMYNKSGVLVKTITLPEIPTNCIFGGKSMNTLYITAGKNLYSLATTSKGFRHPFDYNAVVTPVVYNHIIPKKIEAEQFNAQSGTTIETTTDAGAGQNIGYIDAGDNLEYTIEVPKTANYTVDFRVASLNGNAGFAVAVDGVTKIAEVAVAATGGWQNWVSLRNTLSLTAGKHTLRLNVTKGGFNLNWMDFKEVVGSNAAPTVNITAPVNGTSVIAGTNITLTANASDVALGTVSSVSFYDGAVLLGTDIASPYSFTWTGAAVGSHVITAKATDNDGAATTSTGVTITVTAIVATDPLTASYFLMKDVSTKDYMRPTSGSVTATITQYEEAVQPTFDSYQWEFKSAPGGYYYILNKWTKNAIQPTNALVAENTGLSQVAFTNQVADEVLWSILPTGGGYYWIKNKKSGLYIRPYNATNGGQGTVAIVQNTLIAGYSSFQWELLAVVTKANAREFSEETENTSTDNTFKIYPNPASDLINLSIETPWELMDLSGVTLLSGNGKQINSASLSSGVYLIKANGQTHKLSIVK